MSNIILPHDITAESGVIATLIMNPEMHMAYENLQPTHFHKPEYQAMFWCITDLYRNGVDKIDKYNLVLKIAERKGLQNRIDRVGGDSFIEQQLDNAPYVARDTIEEYRMVARKVFECHLRREIYTDVKTFERQLLDEESDLNELNNTIIDKLGSSAEKLLTDKETVLYSQKIDSILEENRKKREENANGMIGIMPAWKELGEYVTYEKGELYIVGARMKSGKSLWLTTEAIHKAKMGLRIMFSDSEMSDSKFTLRVLSIISGIPIEDIKRERISDYNEQKYLDAIHFLKHAELHHEYMPIVDKNTLKMKCKIIKNKFQGLDMLVHDYLKSTKVTDASQKSAELGDFANTLKNNICGDMNLIGLSAVQMNRGNEIANSDEIARYTSYILGFAKKNKEQIMDEGYECGNRRLWIPVGRDGGELEYDDGIDMYIDDRKDHTNLRLLIANKQHTTEAVPEFMRDEDDE